MNIHHLDTQNPLRLRSLIISLGLICMSTTSYAQLRADPTPAQSITGAWIGHYQCRGERHPLLLKIRETRNGRIHARFNAIYEGSDYLSFNMRGNAKRAKGKVRLSLVPRDWVERPHRDLISLPLTGRLRGQRLTGRIDHPKCGVFEVNRLECNLDSADPCSRGSRGQFARFLDRHGERKIRKTSAPKLTPALSIPVRQAMGEETFNPLMRQFKDASFHNQKLSLLKLVIEHHYFTVLQTQQILQEFSFDSHRLTALKLLAPRIDTLSQAFTLLESFTFQSNKKQAQKILNTAQKAAQLREEKQRLAALERARAVHERRQARERRRENERERRRDRRRARNHDDHDDRDHHDFHDHDDHDRTARETRRETRRDTRRETRRETRRARRASRRETQRDEGHDSGVIARIFTGERCPAGWMLAPYKWVKANPKQACNAPGMGEWGIARIAGGGSQDGIGYQCKSRRTDRRDLGHALCIQTTR